MGYKWTIPRKELKKEDGIPKRVFFRLNCYNDVTGISSHEELFADIADIPKAGSKYTNKDIMDFLKGYMNEDVNAGQLDENGDTLPVSRRVDACKARTEPSKYSTDREAFDDIIASDEELTGL